MKRKLFVSLAVLPLLGPASVEAQYLKPPPLAQDGRLILDVFAAGHKADRMTTVARGVGARLSHALGGERERSARAYVGAFVARTEATPDRTARTPGTFIHAGVEADWVPVSRPLGGRIDPFVSFGVGALRTERGESLPALRPATRATVQLARGIDASRPPGPTTNMTVAPGVGLRAMVLPGVALRLDVRDAIALGATGSHTLEFAAGISLRR